MTTLLVCMLVLVATADTGYRYLDYRSTSAMTPVVSAGTYSARITPVGAINLQGQVFEPRPAVRRLYGRDEDGFFDDEEGFDTIVGDDEDELGDYDVYTEEPGKLPVGNALCLVAGAIIYLFVLMRRRKVSVTLCTGTNCIL